MNDDFMYAFEEAVDELFELELSQERGFELANELLNDTRCLSFEAGMRVAQLPVDEIMEFAKGVDQYLTLRWRGDLIIVGSSFKTFRTQALQCLRDQVASFKKEGTEALLLTSNNLIVRSLFEKGEK